MADTLARGAHAEIVAGALLAALQAQHFQQFPGAGVLAGFPVADDENVAAGLLVVLAGDSGLGLLLVSHRRIVWFSRKTLSQFERAARGS